MIRQMYAILDQAAAFYTMPFTARTHAEAIRMFKDSCKDPNTPMGQNPHDFTLYHIGEYNDVAGMVTPIDHQVVYHGSNVIPFLNEQSQTIEPTSDDQELLDPQTDIEDAVSKS